MKYLIIDDEHELYELMFADLFKTNEFNIEEIPRMRIPKFLKPIYQLHFSDKINRHFYLPLKSVWTSFYELHKYPFKGDEQYRIIFMNGSLRYHFNESYLYDLKKGHPNIKLVMILYDSFSNPTAKRSISMIPLFDYVFSFDEGDCIKHGFERIYSTFSKPDFVHEDVSLKSKAFFIGFGLGRLKLLQDSFETITRRVDGCKFYIAGVPEKDRKEIKNVVYNETIPYSQELQMAFNTDCIVEIVKEGQTGVTLRTCEAIAFNKKLLTNNIRIKEMPFYDARYMSVFETPKAIDTSFVLKSMGVQYEDIDYFSPLKIIERLECFTD